MQRLVVGLYFGLLVIAAVGIAVWSRRDAPSPAGGGGGKAPPALTLAIPKAGSCAPPTGRLSPGQPWGDPASGLALVYVPAGLYPQGAGDLGEDEKPVHAVRLGAFWIGQTEVTNGHYRRYQSATGAPAPAFWTDPRFHGDQQPVVGVSWGEARSYCQHWGMELPWEAEWEAAARGPEGYRYPWGNHEPTAEHANFGGREGRTTVVGSYPQGAGPFGTLDQAGNVWEWCADAWDPEAYRKRLKAAVGPPTPEGDAGVRVVRGGSWFNPARDLRAAHRIRWHGSYRGRFRGFRCVCRAGLEPEE